MWVLLVTALLLATAAAVIVVYTPKTRARHVERARLQAPSAAHPFGQTTTDATSRA